MTERSKKAAFELGDSNGGRELPATAERVLEKLSQRLAQLITPVGPSEAREGFVVLLGTLIALLVSCIGDDLTFRVLGDVWPDLPMVRSVQPIRKNGTSSLEMTP
jgi:hypothetical protein